MFQNIFANSTRGERVVCGNVFPDTVKIQVGLAGDYLASETWYDRRGDVAKVVTGSGPFRKFAYDGAGRLVARWSSPSYRLRRRNPHMAAPFP